MSEKQAKQYMAINQWGHTYHGLTHPRKELIERIGVQHVEKMYTDMPDGKAAHIGYIIAGEWLRLYEVTPVYNEAGW